LLKYDAAVDDTERASENLDEPVVIRETIESAERKRERNREREREREMN
jgi:hypothetical protein